MSAQCGASCARKRCDGRRWLLKENTDVHPIYTSSSACITVRNQQAGHPACETPFPDFSPILRLSLRVLLWWRLCAYFNL
jgi:hypothetical protein